MNGIASGVVPDDVDLILSCVVRRLSNAEESERSLASDVHLLRVVSRLNEDDVWRRTIACTKYSLLDTGELLSRADQNGVRGTSAQWIPGWSLTFRTIEGCNGSRT